jgi:tetratricopeptide (TPR) repeat protein
MNGRQPVRVFYSYAHADEVLRNELARHLRLLQRQGIITSWHDRNITAGSPWKDMIDQHLEDAQVILLLISPDFLASDYCYDIEMRRALERHAKDEARVIPIHLCPVDWQGAAFAALQALPTDARPVTTWANRDEAFKNIAEGIRKAALAMRPPAANIAVVRTDAATSTRVTWPQWIGVGLLCLAVAGGVLGWYTYKRESGRIAPFLEQGQRLLATGQYSSAKKVYKQALAQSWFAQSTAQLGLEKASVYEAEDGTFQRDTIKQRIQRIQQHRPHDPHAYLFLGDLQASQDAYREAQLLYKKAIAADPTLAHGYYSLGVILDKLEQPEEALEMYKEAVKHADWYPLYANNLAGQYCRKKSFRLDAIKLYQKTLAMDGEFLLPYFDIAACYRALGQLDQAVRYQQKGVALLDTPTIAAQEKNKQAWYLSLGDERLHLDTLPRKQCYASRSLAAMLRALDRPEAAARYEQKPCALDGLDHGVGHLVSMTTPDHQRLDPRRVETRKLPRHP